MASTNYRRGRDFEYKVRDHLRTIGAVYVMRSAGSKTKVDLVAFFTTKVKPNTWLVQVKKDGKISATDRQDLIDLASKTETQAVLAKAGNPGVVLEHL